MNETEFRVAVDVYLATALRWPFDDASGDAFWPDFGPSSFPPGSRKTAENDVRTFLEAALAESFIFDDETANAAACFWLARQGGLRGGFLNADWGDRSSDLNALAAVFPKMNVVPCFGEPRTVELVRRPVPYTFFEIHLLDDGRFAGSMAEVLAIWPSLEHRLQVLSNETESALIAHGQANFGIRWIVKRTIYK